MNKNIVKNPISIDNISKGDDIVIYHSNSNPEYMSILESVSITYQDNLIHFVSNKSKFEDTVYSKNNWISIGLLSDFSNIPWNERKFLKISDLKENYPYFIVLYTIDKTPIEVYEIMIKEKSENIILISHNPYEERLEIANKKYCKLIRNEGGYLVSFLKTL